MLKVISPLRASILLIVCASAAGIVRAQDDEVRQATGLPTLIGENTQRGSRMNVSGRISLNGVDKLTRRPVVNVFAQVQGATADRTIATDQGYYVLKNVSRSDLTLVVEVDGIEVVRHPVSASVIGNPRFDFTVQWPQASRDGKPSVIRADQTYARSDANEALLAKAIAAGKTSDPSKAVVHLNDLLTAEPEDFAAWTELGTVYFRLGQFDNAEACYFKAIELKRDYFAALLNLGKLYVGRKKFEDAVLVLSNAVAAAPSSPDARHFFGEALLSTKKNTQAVAQLNEALRLAPNDKADLHLRLAALYDAVNLKGKAATEYKAFLQKRPEYADKAALEKYILENPVK